MATKQTEIVIALGVTFSFATCAMGLRLPARRITRVDLWWDDYFCVGAYLFAVAWCVLILLWISEGLGRHLDFERVSEEDAFRTAALFTFFLQLAYAWSIALAKFTILAFYWRVFDTSSIRWPIIILAILSGAWLLIRTFMTIFHCVPVQAYWDESITDATCLINDSAYLFWSTLAHFVLDVVIIVLPTVEIRKLQQYSTTQKLGTSALFAFGILVCAASLIVVVLASHYNPSSKDLSFNISTIMLWATIEVNLSVVSACLPLFRPVFITVKKNSTRAPGPNYDRNVLPLDRDRVSVGSFNHNIKKPAPPPTRRSTFYRDSKDWLHERVAMVRGRERSVPNFSIPKSIHENYLEGTSPRGVPEIPHRGNFI